MSGSALFIPLAKAGSALGRGLVAGLAGTAAITLSQTIEMKLTGRGSSDAVMKVSGKALGVEPKGKARLEKIKKKGSSGSKKEEVKKKVEANKNKFSQLMHLAYGTSWGVARGIMDIAGLRGASATLLHFGSVWGTALVMLPAADAAKPVTKWPAKQIAIDVLHHAVYAVAAGLVYDAMPRGQFKKKRNWNFLNR